MPVKSSLRNRSTSRWRKCFRAFKGSVNNLVERSGSLRNLLSQRRTKSAGKRNNKDPVKRVSAKLEEGDFKGAVHLACSSSTIADRNDATLEALKKIHPPPHQDTSFPPLGEESSSISVSEEEIIGAIRSIPNGSAGGPDGLNPQYMKDMIQPTTIDCGAALTSALARFVSLVLEGKTPLAIRPFFFRASLTVLTKKEGGVRPIAVGCTLRCLVAKVAGSKVRDEMIDLLAPIQLGYSVRGGAEAVVHAARLYMQDLKQKCVLKLDFRNAFNSLRRDKILQAVKSFAPNLLPLAHSAYLSPSLLFLDDKSIESAEGVQQGYPLGPLLSSSALQFIHLFPSLSQSFACGA